MTSNFTSDFFAGNRERLRQLFTGTAPIVITANGRMQKTSDEAYPFHQDSNFWYLTGIDEPDAVLVMDKAAEFLIIPGRDGVYATFDGAVDIAELTRISGITDVYNEKEGWRQLTSRIKRVKHVATLAAPSRYLEGHAIYTNPARAVLTSRLKDIHSDLELLDLRTHLSHMRMVKQPPELLALQQAVAITGASLKDVFRPAKLSKFAYEYELEADIARGFRRRGADGHAFTPIVAGGARACTLHNVSNSAPLASDELIVVDVGASYDHYAADITRTVSMRDMTHRQTQIYDAVVVVQQHAMSSLKPGVIIKDYEQAIETFMGEKLRELGLIKKVEHDEVRRFFPHATSHFLGLDAHDAGDYNRPIEPGVVLTVEPGIYIPDEGIGVRIEDDVVITIDGCELL